ncbi:hypothetical protein BDV33DRAFT_125065 [Aspergillus novoparasiticus]|uniref:Uncharacterized protein n=1 Tax=Aspergillus novoparasiticus TaxID=986946 RepID=A0A5N6F610_9EURO|nr:hypothetical protein BDV33DRAFT_125065 [Aspergillus novoparasiticus]
MDLLSWAKVHLGRNSSIIAGRQLPTKHSFRSFSSLPSPELPLSYPLPALFDTPFPNLVSAQRVRFGTSDSSSTVSKLFFPRLYCWSTPAIRMLHLHRRRYHPVCDPAQAV